MATNPAGLQSPTAQPGSVVGVDVGLVDASGLRPLYGCSALLLIDAVLLVGGAAWLGVEAESSDSFETSPLSIVLPIPILLGLLGFGLIAMNVFAAREQVDSLSGLVSVGTIRRARSKWLLLSVPPIVVFGLVVGTSDDKFSVSAVPLVVHLLAVIWIVTTAPSKKLDASAMN